MKVFLYSLICFCFLISASLAFAGMTSDNYRIDWDSVNSGGTDNSSSDNYGLLDTLGQLVSGSASSENYQLLQGYRIPEGEDLLLFSIEAQNNDTEIAYTAFDNINLQVTVATSVGYVVGDYIAVVENKGQGQLVAIGKIATTTETVITVDSWQGYNATMSASPTVGHNIIYKLAGHAIDFNLVNEVSLKTGVSVADVTITDSNGYMIFMSEDHNLRASTTDFSDVSDSEVTIGQEEYGIETIGSQAQGIGDWAITSDKQMIASSSTNMLDSRTGVIYKISAGDNSVGGAYQHTVSFYCTARY